MGCWSQSADVSACSWTADVSSDAQGRACSAGNNVSVWLSLMRGRVRAAPLPGRGHVLDDGQARFSAAATDVPCT